jgi:hypothetical protein
MRKFSTGDQVVVSDRNLPRLRGQKGVVVSSFEATGKQGPKALTTRYIVEFSNGERSQFSPGQLSPAKTE